MEVAAGSAAAGASYDDLEAFVAAEGQRLMRFAWLLTRGDDAVSQDLVQAALTAMVERGFDGIRHPKAFARRAITNGHHDLSRHQRVHERVAPRLHEGTAVTDEVAEALVERSAVLTALDRLSERERSVVVLRYYEDLDDTEIAVVLGCARSTVRSLARRGLRRMRHELDVDGPVGPGGRRNDG